ncbi:MAG: HEAT repeat domain-containing protein [Candidatus Eremiobacteraeota bacterium]|nr:HEAT repeat domain-containing protein [Candidatus Eremiobacteraeota bacterium]
MIFGFRCVTVLALFSVIAMPCAAAPPKIHPRPYGRGEARYHKTAVAPYRFENQIIAVSFDFVKGIVFGETTSVVYPKQDGLREVPFDSVRLRYKSVSVNGISARYRVTTNKLFVTLDRPAMRSDKLSIVASYEGRPSRGIYFIRPDAAYPHMQPEIWSQGEEEDNRRWFPTWDEPNEKSPSEIIATVPRGWRVIANGTLAATQHTSTTSTFDWRETHPHSTYLTAFSAGPYEQIHDSLGPLPIDYYVSKADAPYARLCFGRTPAMIAFFQQKIGIAFPWEKYSQTTVERFTAGGMENASATTQTEFAIHPAAYELEQPCDGLVSHELSHQWWGDDVTTPDWANIWINEGFATYFEELWAQHHFGQDRFTYERYHDQQSYFKETGRYWRPIVEYRYAQAGDSFDASGYPRPGEVLHMLRYVLGENSFWKALHAYLAAYQYGTADTQQFKRAIEQSSGRDLGWFFNEWFYRASYPHYVVQQHYDHRTHALRLDITQKNHQGIIFRMPVTVAVTSKEGTRAIAVEVAKAHQRVTIPNLTSAPLMVLFDANNNILRKLDFGKPVSALRYQATHAASVADRLWAVDRLSIAPKKDRGAARAAVRVVVLRDRYYGVRADALDAAGALDDAETVRLALHDADPRVQIAAGNEVASLDHPNVAALVSDLRALTRERNSLVAGAAYEGLGATKAPGVEPLLLAGLRRHAFREVIARGALGGLGHLGDPAIAGTIQTHAKYGADEAQRPDALAALGAIGKKHPTAVLGFLENIALHDPYFRARRAAVAALGKMGSPSAIPALRTVKSHDPEAGLQNAAYDAIADIDDSLAEKTKKSRLHREATHHEDKRAP